MTRTQHTSKPAARKAATKRKRQRAAKKPKAPRSVAEYNAKPEQFKDRWDHVIGVISKMRAEDCSLETAAKEFHVDPNTVKRWAGSALRKQANGRWTTKKRDSLLRLLMIPTSNGTHEIAVRGSGQATQLSKYWISLQRYLQTGDSSELKKFDDKFITDANGKKVPLITDLRLLNRLGSAGVLSFESLYARTA